MEGRKFVIFMISVSDNCPGGRPLAPATAVKKLDSSNLFGVGKDGSGWIVINRVPSRLTAAAAVNLAAWLMLLADPTGEKFEAVVREIKKS